MHSQHSPQTGGGGFLRSRTGIVLIVFLAIATFYLVTEHTAHFFGLLPYGLLLLCPILHLLMHGGHGGHGGHGEQGGQAGQGSTTDHTAHQAHRAEGDER